MSAVPGYIWSWRCMGCRRSVVQVTGETIALSCSYCRCPVGYTERGVLSRPVGDVARIDSTVLEACVRAVSWKPT